jgi:threonine dehydrogenase-like Zn-dependent dehydrogenase
MMLALRKTAPAPGLSLAQVDEPGAPDSGEVLIEVAATGICGSDVHVFEWAGSSYDFMSPLLPVTLGHEFSGRIAAVGVRVSGLAEGDLVTVIPTSSCMQCKQCISGRPFLCNARKTIGLTRDGSFARFVRAPAMSCILLPPETDPAIAALVEPLCVGDNAANVGEVRFGDTVVVLGPGTIGQAVARAARWRGAARVVVVGKNDRVRLQTALKIGATDVIDLEQCGNLKDALSTITGGHLADVVIEATGHPSSISDGMSVLRKEGILVSAGIHAVPANIELTSLVRNRQQLRGAHGAPRNSWEAIVQRIAEEPESVRPMISLQMGLHEALAAFEMCRAREVSKVILRPGVES